MGAVTFVQVEFLYFFAALFALYWALPSRRLQNALLMVASALFYGWVHPFWLVLLYTAALLDFGAAIAMEKWPDHRKLVLGVSLTANLALLGYYKYCDFFIENVAAVLDTMGVGHSLVPLGVILPAGISFYTFQSMAYSIDVYRGELKARRNLSEYLLAVSFFAHLVAGPVQRASNLLQQAETARVFSWTMVRSGFALAMWGAFKKIVVADTVSPYVDKIFAVADPSTPMIVAGTLGFTVQILADFSGYTDIARGVARMLGWELMENDRNPYIATTPSDFWRRWHISFSTWIKDYVYFTFGGSRGTRLRTAMATMGAMLISGLWHGAAWNFVLWGGYHGLLTVVYREAQPRLPKALREMPGGRYAAMALMFCFTVFGWYLFRETSLTRIAATLTRDPLASTQEQWIATSVMLAVTALAATPLLVAFAVDRLVIPKIERSEWYLPAQTTAWAVFALGMFVFVRMSATDFIYFQF
jgi:D-alanyl-lipoteichoic acid acyltransferase DltB (MBOAT superfamily)